MINSLKDPLGVCIPLEFEQQVYTVWSLTKLAERLDLNLSRIPYSIRLLLESLLRSVSMGHVDMDTVDSKIHALVNGKEKTVIPYLPSRVLMQDFTGVPVLVDLAAMRESVKELGGDPTQVNPVIQTDVVVDHSIIVDYSNSSDAFERNTKLEFQRNQERYKLLRWGEQTFQNLRVFPPGMGICHQINLEYLASVIQVKEWGGAQVIFPDSVCGTDSHTTMINGLGVLGWGVGGLEAEAVMLGHPLMLVSPSVVGVELKGRLRPGVTTTDLVLTITDKLRREGVVDQFVEFTGEGMRFLSLAERATIANMAPEYGATCAYFPVDDEALCYLRMTGRSEAQVKLVENYYKLQGLYWTENDQMPMFNKRIEFRLDEVEPSVAGPVRPQDRIVLKDLKTSFKASLETTLGSQEFSQNGRNGPEVRVQLDDQTITLTHGSILLAAITSCTNTSNPAVMIAAGLLARNAVERNLCVPAYVKTSLSPGSQVVSDYLASSGLMIPLEALGFHVTGYGCMTCSGSSGPIDPRIALAVKEQGIVTSSVLSGNRNFEGRIHPSVQANYLASPPLVIAYAIAGTVCIDLEHEPIGYDKDTPVYLHDIWPSDEEIAFMMRTFISKDMYIKRYDQKADERWQAIPMVKSELYHWEENSTYIKKPPYFDKVTAPKSIIGGRVLALLGDSITTDHISPGGVVDSNNPAGLYLKENGVEREAFNTYGSRRGNHEVLMRATLANIRLKNKMLPGVEGGFTMHYPSNQMMTIYDAAMRYTAEDIPLVIISGKEYGTGSSRDWAAKGPKLLGVKAVISESFERIHRSNLICMGILPLAFQLGENSGFLGLDGSEIYEISGIEQLQVGMKLSVKAQKENGDLVQFMVRACIESDDELKYYQSGGILPLVIKNMQLSMSHFSSEGSNRRI
ncbi:aconitate hydratase AcnA [Thermoactinomyces sp. DSM 45892]|uniref:aconitate hydratase AcnA n=1 Tax=Thermoactinomyces sp. DSM 45892 TaxID=1882753 RepID=UPI000894F70D|nr:aconitate hydratase AcnA [Thermoactinomyces sp. DSM 45892]SDZ14630.1 aconitase /2-methylcitrate dehydratase (trans-methylaconitate-forming) [Thermoactinomyces sp. DSM 45892]